MTKHFFITSSIFLSLTFFLFLLDYGKGGTIALAQSLPVSCYTYKPLFRNPGPTTNIQITSGGQIKTISIVTQNPPSILQEMVFATDYAITRKVCVNDFVFAPGDMIDQQFLVGNVTIPFNEFPNTLKAGPFPYLPGIWYLDHFNYEGVKDIGGATAQAKIANEDAIIEKIASNNPFTIKETVGNQAIIDRYLRNKQPIPASAYTSQTVSAPATNCVQLGGAGQKKIVFMRGKSWKGSIDDFIFQADAVRSRILATDPFKKLGETVPLFSFSADLRKQTEDSGIASRSSCSAPAFLYIIFVSDPSNPLTGWSAPQSGIAYVNIAKSNLFDANSPKSTGQTVLREIGRAVAGLEIENYTVNSSGKVSEPLTNCVTDVFKDFRDQRTNHIYGATDAKGCRYETSSANGKLYFRSENESLLHYSTNASALSPQAKKYSVIQCGAISRVLAFMPKEESWKACQSMDTVKDGIPPVYSAPKVSRIKQVTPVADIQGNQSTYKETPDSIGISLGSYVKIQGTGFTPKGNSIFFRFALSGDDESQAYELTNLPSMGEHTVWINNTPLVFGDSIVFKIPDDIPFGDYLVKIGALNSDWSDFPHSEWAQSHILIHGKAPSNLIANAAKKGTVDLSWFDNSSDETGFAMYRFQGDEAKVKELIASFDEFVSDYPPNGSGIPYTKNYPNFSITIFFVKPDVTSYSDTEDLQASKKYTYIIKAKFDTRGSPGGRYSKSSNLAEVVSLPKPKAPALYAKAISDTELELSWQGDVEIKKYDRAEVIDTVKWQSFVPRINAGESIAPAEAEGVFKEIIDYPGDTSDLIQDVEDGLTPSTTYCYAIRAEVNPQNISDASNLACATTLAKGGSLEIDSANGTDYPLQSQSGSSLSGSASLSLPSGIPGISRAELFYGDGTLIGTRSGVPWDFSFDSTIIPNGRHNFYAIIYTTPGKSITTKPVSVIINNPVELPRITGISATYATKGDIVTVFAENISPLGANTIRLFNYTPFVYDIKNVTVSADSKTISFTIPSTSGGEQKFWVRHVEQSLPANYNELVSLTIGPNVPAPTLFYVVSSAGSSRSARPGEEIKITGSGLNTLRNAVRFVSSSDATKVYEIKDVASVQNVMSVTVPSAIVLGNYKLQAKLQSSDWSNALSIEVKGLPVPIKRAASPPEPPRTFNAPSSGAEDSSSFLGALRSLATGVYNAVSSFFGGGSEIEPPVSANASLVQNEDGSVQKTAGTDIQSLNNLLMNGNTLSTVLKNEALKKVLIERQAKMLILAKENPELFLKLALIPKFRAQIPADLLRYVEQEISDKEGLLDVLHVDDFDHPKNSRYDYFITLNGKRLEFYPTGPVYARSGTKVRLSGYQLENTLVAKVGAMTILNEPPLDSVGNQRTAIVLLTTPEHREHPFTKEEAYDLFFNGQFQAFYKEQSYDQISFSGDVYGWFDTDKPAESCQFPTIDEVVNTYKINPASYDRIVYAWTGSLGGCSFVGKLENLDTTTGVKYSFSRASIGVNNYSASSQWGSMPFPWTNLDALVSHEIGHSLGVGPHANGWDCGEEILYGECTRIDYGNPFDVMGGNTFSLHINGVYKEMLGWLNGRIISISKTGRYKLNPLELNAGKVTAKVVAQNGQSLFSLEYRQPIGFDAGMNTADVKSNQQGLLVNKILDIPYSSSLKETQLLDLSPNSNSWYWDRKESSLNGVQVFSNPDNGITIGPIVSADTNGITFDVNIGPPQCVPHPPIIESWAIPPATTMLVGQNAPLNPLYFDNKNSVACEGSLFRLYVTSDAKLEIAGNNEKKFVSQNSTGFFGFSLKILKQTPGDYTVRYSIIDEKYGGHVEGTFPLKIIDSFRVTSITPDPLVVGKMVTITGSSFSTRYSSRIWFYRLQGVGVIYAESLSSDGKTLTFVLPSTYYDLGNGFGRPKAISVPVESGSYKSYTWTDGADMSIDRQVTIIADTPLRVLSPQTNDIFHAGALMPVSWSGGPSGTSTPMRMSFWRSGTATTTAHFKLIQGITTPNDGSESWVIPKDVLPGFYFVELACADKATTTPCLPKTSPLFRIFNVQSRS